MNWILVNLAVAADDMPGSLHAATKSITWEQFFLGIFITVVGFWTVRWITRTDQKYDGSAKSQAALAKVVEAGDLAIRVDLEKFKVHVAENYPSRATLFELFTNPNNQAHANIENFLRDFQTEFREEHTATREEVASLRATLQVHIAQNGKKSP